MRLTDMRVQSLKPDPTKHKIYYDETIKGFGVRVSKGGTKAFVLSVGKNRDRTTIGQYPIVSLAKAREVAKDLLAKRQLERHQPKRPERKPLGDALDLYNEQHLSKLAERTSKEQRRLFNRHLGKLKSRDLSDIATDDITRITDKIAPSEGEHLHRACKTFFRWCMRRRLLQHSPIEGLELPSKWKPRERVLTDDELAAIYRKAQDGSPFGQIVRLLILTGQRRGQIAQLRRDFIDEQDELINWPSRSMKGARPHSLPLMPMVAEILSGLPKEGYLFLARGKDTPFNGFSPSKQALDAELKGVAAWTLHDLRRTFSTGLARLRVPPHIKEMLLAHAAAKSPIEAIYDRYTYLDEMREALGKWHAFLQTLLASTEAVSEPKSA